MVVCSSENIRIHVTGDILGLDQPKSLFKDFTPHTSDKPLAPIRRSREVLKPAGLDPGTNCLLVALPTIENTYSYHTVKGPSKFDDPDIAALLVMTEILDAMEGILWKLIRGQGLAYSCFLNSNVEAGLIEFTIYKSPNAFKAFEQAKIVIDRLAKNELDIDAFSVEGAKSAVIYSLVAKENTMDRAALQSFVNQVLKKMPATYNRNLLNAIQVRKKNNLVNFIKLD